MYVDRDCAKWGAQGEKGREHCSCVASGSPIQGRYALVVRPCHWASLVTSLQKGCCCGDGLRFWQSRSLPRRAAKTLPSGELCLGCEMTWSVMPMPLVCLPHFRSHWFNCFRARGSAAHWENGWVPAEFGRSLPPLARRCPRRGRIFIAESNPCRCFCDVVSQLGWHPCPSSITRQMARMNQLLGTSAVVAQSGTSIIPRRICTAGLLISERSKPRGCAVEGPGVAIVVRFSLIAHVRSGFDAHP